MGLAEPKQKKKRIDLDPRNLTWRNNTSNFGYQMLLKMGWQEGQGLGANNSGITEYIRSSGRSGEDLLGLGAKPNDLENDATEATSLFDSLLKDLASTSPSTALDNKSTEDVSFVFSRSRFLKQHKVRNSSSSSDKNEKVDSEKSKENESRKKKKDLKKKDLKKKDLKKKDLKKKLHLEIESKGKMRKERHQKKDSKKDGERKKKAKKNK